MSTRACATVSVSLAAIACTAFGTISIGPYTFDNNAFADRAVQAEAGALALWGPATDLTSALVGYHLDRQLVNIGYDGNANLFDLYFDDVKAADGAGADIVLFDVRFSEDPYEVALTIDGGETWSGFQLFPPEGQTSTGVNITAGNFELFGINVDIAAYGIPASSSVDGIRFRALTNANGIAEGDPIMAAVLNSVPATGSLGTVGLAAIISGRRRRGAVV